MRAPSARDLNSDGLVDALYGFWTFDCGFQPGDTTGILTGSLTGGTAIEGQDSVQTPGDLDGDGDADGMDFLTFSGCYNGSGNRPYSGCASPTADLDEDGDVDGDDFLTFSNCYNGSKNRPRLP